MFPANGINQCKCGPGSKYQYGMEKQPPLSYSLRFPSRNLLFHEIYSYEFIMNTISSEW